MRECVHHICLLMQWNQAYKDLKMCRPKSFLVPHLLIVLCLMLPVSITKTHKIIHLHANALELFLSSYVIRYICISHDDEREDFLHLLFMTGKAKRLQCTLYVSAYFLILVMHVLLQNKLKLNYFPRS